MNFCGHCGARATGTPYCTNCGQPMDAASAPTAPAAGAEKRAEAYSGAPQGSAAAEGAGTSVPPRMARRSGPFAAITIGDYVRDALALLLLLVSLGLPWDLEDGATGKVYVILVTLLSIISLSLPYLKAVAVIPPSLAPAQQRLARLVANLPYVVVVLVTVVLAYLGDTEVSGLQYGNGVGVGVAVGLAGALLAAQARSSEQDAAGDGGLWRAITLGLVGLAVITGVISGIIFLVDFGESAEWSQIVAVILALAFFVVLPLLATLGLLRGEVAGRDATIMLGAVGLLAAFWALGASDTIGDVWSMRLPINEVQLGGPQFLFWPAIGVAASAPGIARQLGQVPGARRWTGLAAKLLELTVATGVFGVLVLAFGLIENEAGRGPNITVLVFTLVSLAAALVGRNALLTDPRAGRSVAMGVAGVLLVIAIVVASVLGAADSAMVDVFDATVLSTWLVFSVAIMVMLVAPPSVRQEMGTFTIGSGVAVAGGTPEHSPADTAGTAREAAAPEPTVQAARPDEAPTQVVTPEATHQADSPDDAPTQVVSAGSAAEEAAQYPASDDAADATQVMGTAGGNGAQVDPAAAEEPTDVPVTDEQPAAPAAPEPEPITASGYTAGMAADPSTPLQTLADIAAKEPSLRPYIAMNPATYPELLEWLGQLGDPAVDDALRQRGNR